MGETLTLPHCPHCQLRKPTLELQHQFTTTAPTLSGDVSKLWGCFVCTSCKDAVLAVTPYRPRQGENLNLKVTPRRATKIYPSLANEEWPLPDKVSTLLQEASETTHAPNACIMVCASAVDAMLKENDYRDGSLFERIGQAESNGLITRSMAEWAHEVRLDANDRRHVDESAAAPTLDLAKQTLEFARALAMYLFVLPDRVSRGRGAAEDAVKKAKKKGTDSAPTPKPRSPE